MMTLSGQATSHARQKKADLASGVGAGILGFGLGVLTAQYVSAFAVPLVVVGIVLHVWGMLERHRLDKAAPQVWWAEALYWLCWVILLIIGGVILLQVIR
jgi:hypothetical protein